MSNETISFCDGCGKQAKYNINYSRPNNWIGCGFECNSRSKTKIDFCSKECLKKYIDSVSLGNDIGHNIKEFASVAKDEVKA